MGEIINRDRYDDLCIAIILQAIDDYKQALSGKKIANKDPDYTIREVEQFFKSEYYDMLCGIDGELILNKILQDEEDWL